jgi:hypothetical protein
MLGKKLIVLNVVVAVRPSTDLKNYSALLIYGRFCIIGSYFWVKMSVQIGVSWYWPSQNLSQNTIKILNHSGIQSLIYKSPLQYPLLTNCFYGGEVIFRSGAIPRPPLYACNMSSDLLYPSWYVLRAELCPCSCIYRVQILPIQTLFTSTQHWTELHNTTQHSSYNA